MEQIEVSSELATHDRVREAEEIAAHNRLQDAAPAMLAALRMVRDWDQAPPENGRWIEVMAAVRSALEKAGDAP